MSERGPRARVDTVADGAALGGLFGALGGGAAGAHHGGVNARQHIDDLKGQRGCADWIDSLPADSGFSPSGSAPDDKGCDFDRLEEAVSTSRGVSKDSGAVVIGREVPEGSAKYALNDAISSAEDRVVSEQITGAITLGGTGLLVMAAIGAVIDYRWRH